MQTAQVLARPRPHSAMVKDCGPTPLVLPRGEDLELQLFHEQALVYDLHFHPRSTVPALFYLIWSRVFRRIMPPLKSLSALRRGGIDGCVLASVCDFQISGPFGRNNGMSVIDRQLRQVRAEVAECGGRLVTTSAEIRKAKEAGELSFVLSLEGGNMLRDVDDLDGLHRLGVRLLTLVHLNDNALGTVGATAWGYWLSRGRKEDRYGLSPLGERVVTRMNTLGMLVDVSHASHRTLMDVTSLTTRPVVASHAGARTVSDFHRYLHDDEIKAIAETGGVIGLWPMYYLGRGMATAEDFKAHLRHIIDLVGVDYVAIGTDVQGVPGLMAGYTGVNDQIFLTRLLFEAGLDDDQVKQVLGLNFLRVFEQAVGA